MCKGGLVLSVNGEGTKLVGWKWVAGKCGALWKFIFAYCIKHDMFLNCDELWYLFISSLLFLFFIWVLQPPQNVFYSVGLLWTVVWCGVVVVL